MLILAIDVELNLGRPNIDFGRYDVRELREYPKLTRILNDLKSTLKADLEVFVGI
jgi:hypothetical protein